MNTDNEFLNNYCSIIFTYKTVGISNLHTYYFRESEIKKLSQLINSELLILQTCNRVELYLYSNNNVKSDIEKIINYLNNVHNVPIGNKAKILCGKDSIKHLFLVASGADSLSIGEYEILSQIKDSIEMFKKLNISGKYLNILFERALKVGRKVREKTGISKGKVGIYSLAVDIAKKSIGTFSDKRIAVVGAGEMAEKITYMLYKENAKNVTILNRTVDRAKNLASKYDYKYEILDLDKIKDFDLVFVAIYHDNLKLENKWNTLIIDITVPPLFTGNNVITLQDLEIISMHNLTIREEEMKKIDELIDEGINELIYDYKKEIYNEIISKIMKRIENITENEIIRAYKKLQKLGIENEEALEILNLMTRSMIKKIFQPVFENIRNGIFNKDDSINYINFLVDIFKDGTISNLETQKIKEKQADKGSSS
ncbi:MAG: glutamyl-tRNA reductase [Sulfolobaceae archaeon]